MYKEPERWTEQIHSYDVSPDEKIVFQILEAITEKDVVQLMGLILQMPQIQSDNHRYLKLAPLLSGLDNISEITRQQYQEIAKFCFEVFLRINATKEMYLTLIHLPGVQITRKQLDTILRNKLNFLLRKILRNPDLLSDKGMEEIRSASYRNNVIKIMLGDDSVYLGDFVNIMLKMEIPEINIEEMIAANEEFFDSSVPTVLLQHHKESWAKKLVKARNVISSEVFAQALQSRCYSFLMFYANWLEGEQIRLGDFPFRILLNQLKTDLGSIEIYYYVLRKFIRIVPFSFVNNFLTFLEQSLKDESSVVSFLVGIANPIKILILSCELIELFKARFSRVKIKSTVLKQELINLIKEIQAEIDDDQHMQLIFFDKDLSNRDVLTVVCLYELVEVFQNDNMEKIIRKLLWNSNYLCEYNIISATSNLNQLLKSPIHSHIDNEQIIRKKIFSMQGQESNGMQRNQFVVWKEAMHLRYIMDSISYIFLFLILFIVIIGMIDTASNFEVYKLNTTGTLSEEVLQSAVVFCREMKCGLVKLVYISYIQLFVGAQEIFVIIFLKLTQRRLKVRIIEIFFDFCIINTAGYYIIFIAPRLYAVNDTKDFQFAYAFLSSVFDRDLQLIIPIMLYKDKILFFIVYYFVKWFYIVFYYLLLFIYFFI